MRQSQAKRRRRVDRRTDRALREAVREALGRKWASAAAAELLQGAHHPTLRPHAHEAHLEELAFCCATDDLEVDDGSAPVEFDPQLSVFDIKR